MNSAISCSWIIYERLMVISPGEALCLILECNLRWTTCSMTQNWYTNLREYMCSDVAAQSEGNGRNDSSQISHLWHQCFSNIEMFLFMSWSVKCLIVIMNKTIKEMCMFIFIDSPVSFQKSLLILHILWIYLIASSGHNKNVCFGKVCYEIVHIVIYTYKYLVSYILT